MSSATGRCTADFLTWTRVLSGCFALSSLVIVWCWGDLRAVVGVMAIQMGRAVFNARMQVGHDSPDKQKAFSGLVNGVLMLAMGHFSHWVEPMLLYMAFQILVVDVFTGQQSRLRAGGMLVANSLVAVLDGVSGQRLVLMILGPLAIYIIAEAQALRLIEALAHLRREQERANKTQRQLAESEERFRLAARATAEVLWDWNVVSNLVCHYEGASGAGHSASLDVRMENLHPRDRKRVLASLNAAISSKADTWCDEYQTRAGRVVMDHAIISRDSEGRAVRMVGAMHDVTDQRRLEAQLVQADRLASIGTLAAGVAHEINNPLSFILSNVTFALEEVQDGVMEGEELRRALTDAADGARRVRDVVRDLKQFSRAETQIVGVDLLRVIELAVKMSQHELKHRTALEVDVPSNLPLARADESRLSQVVLNLLVNAAQAMPERPADQNRIVLRAGEENGELFFEIEDNGNGIPPETLPRIFDAFFTTKPLGVGTGLGLSISHSIISSFGGSMAVRSEVGIGTYFRVTLVRWDESVNQAKAKAETHANERFEILIIDDDEQVARGLARTLRRDHDVTIVSSPHEAESVLEQGAFDLILCDVVMPQRSGVELYEALQAKGIPLDGFAFMTGGAITESTRHFLGKTDRPVLEKPFDVAQLQKVMKSLREKMALAA